MLHLRCMLPVILLGIGTAIAAGGWFFVLFKFDPFASGIAAPLLFYASFAFATLGAVMLGGLGFFRWRRGRYATRREFGVIARQALLFTLFTAAVLYLASVRLLRWWNIIPLALVIIIAEMFIASLNRAHDKQSSRPVKAQYNSLS